MDISSLSWSIGTPSPDCATGLRNWLFPSDWPDADADADADADGVTARRLLSNTARMGQPGYLGMDQGQRTTAGHPGVNRGFHAQLLVNPGDDVALVVVTKGDNGAAVIEAVLRAWRDACSRCCLSRSAGSLPTSDR